ncbi:YlbL family protein [Brachybacterium sp. DNPG3]
MTPDADPDQRARTAIGRWIEEARFHRPVLALVSLALLCLMILATAFVPVPYVIESPGPAIDVLGEYDDEQILTIDGAETYETDGSLMMTTVAVSGGPGYPVTAFEVMVAWFTRSEAVLPRETVYPDGQTQEETQLTNTVQMNSSQQGAVAVALEELGMDVEQTVVIAGVETGAPADGVLEAGDELVSVGGETAADVAGFQRLVAATTPGDAVDLVVRRDGEEVELSVPTEDVDGEARMGVVLSVGYDFPIDVAISVGDVGGPSAGTMFALSVYDELTPGALTGGEDVAGTGTISADGTVGAIGGIRQKMVGASEAGADFFLAPASNCDEVVGYEPDGLSVVAVSTFDEALTATETIAETGTVEGLPTCEDS